MTFVSRALLSTAALLAASLVFGFVMFASATMRDRSGETAVADGIVVFTGGDTRIEAGVELLRAKRGSRLLISGVNKATTRDDIQRLSGLTAKEFACCVDLGYEALDTIGNADETRGWANSRGYKSLIIVTSSYHMPRSIAELSIALPGTDLIPHAVTPKDFPDSGWWLHVSTTRHLLSEYVKYLPTAARLAAVRLMGWHSGSAIASTMPKRADG